jgi:hypothetical protein
VHAAWMSGCVDSACIDCTLYSLYSGVLQLHSPLIVNPSDPGAIAARCLAGCCTPPPPPPPRSLSRSKPPWHGPAGLAVVDIRRCTAELDGGAAVDGGRARRREPASGTAAGALAIPSTPGEVSTRSCRSSRRSCNDFHR